MPAGFPWGTPSNFVHEGYALTFASMLTSSPVMSMLPPILHTLPRVEETIYHSKPSEGPMKDLFGKSVVKLCLVPNVKNPVKFKVPDFENYKGNTFPMSHLVMYGRKMCTQTDKN